MANRKVRATALTHTSNGRPLAPGDEVTVPDVEAERLVDSGRAVMVAVPSKVKEKADAASRK